MTMDTTALSTALAAKLGQVQAAVRPAAQTGAEHIYFEARLRCPVSAEAHFFYGRQSKKTGERYYFRPGNLRDALYQAFSKDKSGKNVATYHVSWNYKEAPYGFMVEYGTSRAAAHPFLRPAIIAAKPQAMQLMKAEFLQRMAA